MVALLHADGQYAPEILQDLYEPLVKDEADIVLGSRMKNYRSALKGGMPLYKFTANICLTALENLVYGMHLSEYHSGYMLYNRKALERIPFEKLSDRFHFDGEMLMVGGLKKLRIKDLPIPTHYGGEKISSEAHPIRIRSTRHHPQIYNGEVQTYLLTFPYRDCSEYACGLADSTP